MNDDNLLDAGHNTDHSASYLVSLRINYSDVDRFASHLAKLNLLLEDHVNPPGFIGGFLV